MKRLYIVLTILVAMLLVTSCNTKETRDGSEKKTIFEQVTKACDGNDMIYLFVGSKSYSGLAVVANHPDCVGEVTE